VLAYLVAHAGQVVTKEALLEAVWPEAVVSEGVLKACMRQIRRALGDSQQTPQYIATVHRRGYRFMTPASVVHSPAAPLAPAAPLSPVHDTPGHPLVSGSPPDFLVAREAELAALQQRYAQACQGERQVVWVTGEAGIGKTTLVDAFVAQVTATDAVWMGRGQCLEQYGAREPYMPLLEALGEVTRAPEGTQLVAFLRQYAPSWLLHMPAFVATEEIEALQRRGGGATQERMLRELAEQRRG
jgi:hypothetical protein